MSTEARVVTPAMLREWALPEPGDSKYSRGQVLVVGGALRSPGAAMLAGIAALRVGAGRLTLAVGSSVAAAVGAAVPETGIVPLVESADGSITGDALAAAADDIRAADAVLLGPGLDDVEATGQQLSELHRLLGDDGVVVLDAFALGALADADPEAVVEPLRGRLLLTPNPAEAGILLGRDAHDLDDAAIEIAARYGAVVTCQNRVAAPDGRLWTVEAGGPTLGTSGSGDVLAGAVAGLAARGAGREQAVVWATFLHATAGDRLAARLGRLGSLARELPTEFPSLLAELER
jgi:hydroxyethylthiazole kinase-like uncharacterized protein yjeF